MMKKRNEKPHQIMRQKDIAEKTLEELSDVFADICNVLLFNGKRVISEKSLSPFSAVLTYRTS